MNEHTPTPWVLGDGPDPDIRTPKGTWIVNQVCSGAMGNNDDGRANGEFIVRAVNSHDELVAACERFTKAMRAGNKPDFLMLVEALHDADAALTKARG